MDGTTRQRLFADWLATRPECVQKLAAEFPMGDVFCLGGRILYLLGWNESDMLIVSAIDPAVDYDRANESREYLCAKHCRGCDRESWEFFS